MQIFKCFVSKGTNKYNIIVKTNTEAEAKNKLHKEGYSILSIKKIDSIEKSGEKFYFKAILNGENKSGSIIAKDIFKVYFKLRDGLKYKILELYSESDKNSSNEQKMLILKNLEEQYNIFKEFNKKNIKKEKEKEIKKPIEKKIFLDSQKHESFYMHKELNKTHKIIEEILDKIKLFMGKNLIYENYEEKNSLENIYNSILKIKTSTNIIKLKQIGELALLKIGKILVEKIEEDKKEQKDYNLEKYRKELLELNILLKKVSSKKSLKEKSLGFNQLIKNFFGKKENNEKLIDKNNKDFIDKSSSSYLKTVVLIRKYGEKSRENTKEIIKKIYIFLLPDFILKFFPNFEELKTKKEILILRKEVINQNIYILKSKAEKNSILKIRIKKFYNSILGPIKSFIKIITISGFYIILFYSIFFIILNIKKYLYGENFKINYWGLFYFLAFFLFLYSLNFAKKHLSKGLKGLIISILNFIILFVVFIFGIINF